MGKTWLTDQWKREHEIPYYLDPPPPRQPRLQLPYGRQLPCHGERLLPRLPWERRGDPVDSVYSGGYINGELTEEERRFVERMYSYAWLTYDRYTIRDHLPIIERFAVQHPIVGNVLGNLLYGLLYYVLPRVTLRNPPRPERQELEEEIRAELDALRVARALPNMLNSPVPQRPRGFGVRYLQPHRARRHHFVFYDPNAGAEWIPDPFEDPDGARMEDNFWDEAWRIFDPD
jgi:hypothetical protein